MLCGVDEAGKGAVIGPLVVAAVGCRRKRDLADLGVRDSKALSPSRREELAAAIRENGFPVAVLVVPAGDIDAGRGFSTMNTIVARSHARVINDLRPHIAVVDACDVIAARYGKAVSEHLDFPCRVVSRHHAELRVGPDGATEIVDLRSLNGTYVNRTLLDGRTVLREGDEIQIGKYRATISLSEPGLS